MIFIAHKSFSALREAEAHADWIVNEQQAEFFVPRTGAAKQIFRVRSNRKRAYILI